MITKTGIQPYRIGHDRSCLQNRPTISLLQCPFFEHPHHIYCNMPATACRLYPDTFDFGIRLRIAFESCTRNRFALTEYDQHCFNSLRKIIWNKAFPVLFSADQCAVIVFCDTIKCANAGLFPSVHVYCNSMIIIS